MNITNYSDCRSLIAVAVAAALLAGCACAPKKPAGSEEVRAKLTALQSRRRARQRRAGGHEGCRGRCESWPR